MPAMRPAEELRYLILAAQREGNRQLGQALKPLGVTTSQAEVIRVLEDRQPLTLNGLGELLVCESGSPSRLVDRLVSAGLVNREAAAHDRRHIELALTPSGAELARRIAEIEETLYQSIDTLTHAHDTEQLTNFLRAFVAGHPSGHALVKRTT
ncbi:MarR family winged helix-turn-helix transcriptional regulator [Streptomyces odonnellii]|uniref:MarR family winged helix-turn-helix transcriptional regulator n=1 Tax=Streptomyces odonnellii TaxID=1417980 RepID=UPI000A6DC352|nr:MarR family transcriptional regulator [Streptomyces odonnellii]